VACLFAERDVVKRRTWVALSHRQELMGIGDMLEGLRVHIDELYAAAGVSSDTNGLQNGVEESEPLPASQGMSTSCHKMNLSRRKVSTSTDQGSFDGCSI
jgi:hypothetical protein